MQKSYSVGQVNAYIKNMFQTDVLLKRVSVSGEVSNCKYHSSGHIYFTLKDSVGSLACIMFSRDRASMDFRMTDGMKIVATGSISVYERDGKYQLYAEKIEKEGQGELYEKYLKLKEELEEMGMFDNCYKQPIPKYATKIGVVTASTGAAIQDIINITTRRNPYVQLYLYPAKVQGEGACYTICEGIRALDKMNLDVLIVGRGGGSIEDLWAFNEECVARAVFDCKTPVISAVGHETDFTIIDFVSDLRAPTPSAAAEQAVFDYNAFVNDLKQYENRMRVNLENRLSRERYRLNTLNRRLSLVSPTKKLEDNRIYLDTLSDNLNKAMDLYMERRKTTLKMQAGKLSALSPLKKISGGFGYLTGDDGVGINSIKEVKESEVVKVRLYDGSFDATVNSIEEL